MSIKRRAAKRDKNEAEIIHALRQVGADVIQLSDKGVPDLLVGYKNRNFLIEVKTDKGKLTPDQTDFFTMWTGQVAVVRTIEEALSVIYHTK